MPNPTVQAVRLGITFGKQRCNNPHRAPSKPPSTTFLGIRRLPQRYAGIVMPFLLSLIMTFIVSLISTARSIGFSKEFLTVWPSSWVISWLIAFPTVLIVLPLVRKLTAAIVEEV